MVERDIRVKICVSRQLVVHLFIGLHLHPHPVMVVPCQPAAV